MTWRLAVAVAALGGLSCHHPRAILPAAAAYSFACGPATCDARATYCEIVKTDVPAIPSNYACKPLPPACKTATGSQPQACGCFPPGTRCDFCSTVVAGGRIGFRRTCVGGATP